MDSRPTYWSCFPSYSANEIAYAPQPLTKSRPMAKSAETVPTFNDRHERFDEKDLNVSAINRRLFSHIMHPYSLKIGLPKELFRRRLDSSNVRHDPTISSRSFHKAVKEFENNWANNKEIHCQTYNQHRADPYLCNSAPSEALIQPISF